ncbi:hypothetical protein [Kocuria kalidii]|uniref:hypothetical protein n=1 Tax=Kocuria kalidii TaxID=3376283 RepID=UPI0037948B8A
MNAAIRHNARTGLAADLLTTAVPGWADLRDTAERLKSEIIRRQGDQAPTLDERRNIGDALLAAKTPAGIEKALDQARADAARRDNLSGDIANLATARDRAEGELNRLERDSVHEITAVVRERVEEIADEIRAMKHQPLSAQHAIDLDAAAEWKQLQQLTGDWTALTGTWSTLCRAGIEGRDITVLSSAAFTGDPLAVHPYFVGRRAQAGHANDRPRAGSFHEAMNLWSQDASTPKFDTTEPRGGAIPKGADPLEWLVYLVDQDAATVHDPEHALALWKAATAATDDITAHSAESRALARAKYARLIGDDELATVEDLRPVLENSRGRKRPASVFA